MGSTNKGKGGKATSASAVQTVELRVLAFGNDIVGAHGKVVAQKLGLLGADEAPTNRTLLLKHRPVSAGISPRGVPCAIWSGDEPERLLQQAIIVEISHLREDQSIICYLASIGSDFWLFLCDRNPRMEITRLGLIKGIETRPPVFRQRFVLDANQRPHVLAEVKPVTSGLGVNTPLSPGRAPVAPWRSTFAPPETNDVGSSPAQTPIGSPRSSVSATPAKLPPSPAPKPAPAPIPLATPKPPQSAPVATPPPEPKPAVEKAPPKARKRRAKAESAGEASGRDLSPPPPPDLVEALVVPVGKVRPFAPSIDPLFPGQPRVWFDPDKLAKLGLSIRKHGQQTPIMAKRLTPPEDGKEFELIDGERRWRALEMIGATHVAITVSRPKSKADQHKSSLIQNFCREDHTHMETSNAIASQVAVGVSLTDLAAAIGQSVMTVCSLHSLQRLVPQLKPLLDPPTPKPDRIRLAEAVELSRIDPARQLEIWEKAKQQPTRGLIRATIKMLGKEFVVHKRTRNVKPSDFSAALERKIVALRLAALNLRQMPQEDVRIAVQSLNGQCKAQIAILTGLIKELDDEKRLLYRLGTAARKAAPTASATA